MDNIVFMPREFLSTLSLRRATALASKQNATQQNFYPRSPCGERHGPLLRCGRYWHISIHALLAESDRNPGHEQQRTMISIHALLAESDSTLFYTQYRHLAFLSTLSLRRATFCPTCQWRRSVISIHALLAESDNNGHEQAPCRAVFLSTLSLRRATFPPLLLRSIHEISIHALLAESDSLWAMQTPK